MMHTPVDRPYVQERQDKGGWREPLELGSEDPRLQRGQPLTSFSGMCAGTTTSGAPTPSPLCATAATFNTRVPDRPSRASGSTEVELR
jgi:hypothetical protein